MEQDSQKTNIRFLHCYRTLITISHSPSWSTISIVQYHNHNRMGNENESKSNQKQQFRFDRDNADHESRNIQRNHQNTNRRDEPDPWLSSLDHHRMRRRKRRRQFPWPKRRMRNLLRRAAWRSWTDSRWSRRHLHRWRRRKARSIPKTNSPCSRITLRTVSSWPTNRSDLKITKFVDPSDSHYSRSPLSVSIIWESRDLELKHSCQLIRYRHTIPCFSLNNSWVSPLFNNKLEYDT